MSLDLDLIYSQFNFKVDKSDKNKIYEFEEFRLDAVHLMLYHHDEEIPLVPKAVETLLVLVEKRGKILSKNELMETIWTDSIVEESNLAQYLHLLRKILGKTKDDKPFIETFRRRGYRFNGEVNVSDFLSEAKPENANRKFTPIHAPTNGKAAREATSGKVVALADWRHKPEEVEKLPEPILPAAQITKFPAAKRKTFPMVGAIAFGLLILALGFFAFSKFRSETPTTDAPITTVAVLPFENESGDADLDYLSDGLSESLIDRLSQLPQLKVIARNSSFKYRGQTINLQDAANKLGVQAIVMGRVVQRGDDLTIRVEMVDARDNKHLWGEQFNRKAADAFAVQREIAQTVSEKLRLKLSGAQEQQFAKQETVDPQAYELLLKGRFTARQAGTENQKKALDYYNQAIAVDPDYALAYAKLSIGYISLSANSGGDPNEFMPKAWAAARKALELDKNLAESHIALASLYHNDWDWSAAEAEYKRAIELNPNLSDAHIRYSDYLGLLGRHKEAIEEAKRGRELDPLSLSANLRIGWALFLVRRYDEAIEETKKAFELNQKPVPTHQFGYVYAAKGMHREAVAAYRESIRLGDTSPSLQIYLGATYAQAGELEKAYAAHDLQLQFLKVDPAFDSLRDDPRFQDLLRRVGLPQ